METMDLSDANDSSMMTPIQNAIMPEPEKIKIEKNMNNIEMDSTPLSDLMSGPEVYDTISESQDPRMMSHMAQPQQQFKKSSEPSFKPKSKTNSKQK